MTAPFSISRESTAGFPVPGVAALVADVRARREARRWPNVVTRWVWGVAYVGASLIVAGYFLLEAVAR